MILEIHLEVKSRAQSGLKRIIILTLDTEEPLIRDLEDLNRQCKIELNKYILKKQGIRVFFRRFDEVIISSFAITRGEVRAPLSLEALLANPPVGHQCMVIRIEATFKEVYGAEYVRMWHDEKRSSGRGEHAVFAPSGLRNVTNFFSSEGGAAGADDAPPVATETRKGTQGNSAVDEGRQAFRRGEASTASSECLKPPRSHSRKRVSGKPRISISATPLFACRGLDKSRRQKEQGLLPPIVPRPSPSLIPEEKSGKRGGKLGPR